MKSVKRRNHLPRKPAIELKPDLYYTSAECCQLLRCSQPTLVRLRRDKGFPLKLVGKGIAFGADIAKWFEEQKDRPVVPRKRRKKLAATK